MFKNRSKLVQKLSKIGLKCGKRGSKNGQKLLKIGQKDKWSKRLKVVKKMLKSTKTAMFIIRSK